MPTAKIRPARQARAAAPVLPSFDALDQTHHQVMQTLGELARLLEHLDARGVDEVARALAGQICRFFDETARAHHLAEERVVFPDLLASGEPELVQHVQRLQQDHGWLEEDWLEIGPHLRAVAAGNNGYDADALRAGTEVFAGLYREHIALEETIVYPAARRRDVGQPAAKAGGKASS